MLDKQGTLDFLRALAHKGELYMFLREVAGTFKPGKTITHFTVNYLHTHASGQVTTETFQVSYRTNGLLKSIQNFQYEFDETQCLQGYVSRAGQLMLVFGDYALDTCICPMHPAVSSSFHCPLCGYCLDDHVAHVPASTNAAGSNYPTVEELVQERYAQQPARFKSFNAQAVADSLGIPVEDVRDIVGLDQSDLDAEAEMVHYLRWFKLPIDGSHTEFPYMRSFSFEEYVLLVQSLHDYSFLHSSLYWNVSHEQFVNLLTAGNVPDDLQICLGLYDSPSVRIESIVTKDDDFVQDYGQLFGRHNLIDGGVHVLLTLGASVNKYPTPYAFTRVHAVVNMLEKVYQFKIRLAGLTPTLNGSKLFPNSIIKVKHIRPDGVFVVTPAADDSREFELPHNFVGDYV